MSLVHVDTSLLVKRYVRTPAFDAVDDLFDDVDQRFALNEVRLVEMESTLARWARDSGAKASTLAQQRVRFENDHRPGFFESQAVLAPVQLRARQLIADDKMPSATLDAIHLATALTIEADMLATDDRQLARAAKAQRLSVISFP